MSEKVSFELKIKYQPKGSNSEKTHLQEQLGQKERSWEL